MRNIFLVRAFICLIKTSNSVWHILCWNMSLKKKLGWYIIKCLKCLKKGFDTLWFSVKTKFLGRVKDIKLHVYFWFYLLCRTLHADKVFFFFLLLIVVTTSSGRNKLQDTFITCSVAGHFKRVICANSDRNPTHDAGNVSIITIIF